ncbi:glutathione peroxidase [Paenibacillus doosanensis]|uniref:glutathione peroxidase n=1 Tax=Paenibacillus doosanensis TaxID=1229154 RepID=UPI002180649C|nr:glutathione peroxidase [Paenibacillus doosanensis]MCS7458609.1 glutathione peroxidase [Paenibacillus doosanensis]
MSVYQYEARTIDGKPVCLSAYRGKVLLIVNTASRCGYSKQFEGLQQLYDAYHAAGLEILGFPCNQFNDKEPENNALIQTYCDSRFGVTFELFEKIEVIGADAHPLFQYMTGQAPFRGFDPQTSDGRWMREFLMEKYPGIYEGDGVKWNFSKFLIDRRGRVKSRYECTIEPADIEPDIRSLLLA